MTDHAAESNRIMDHLGENVIAVEGQTDATMIATVIDALRHATLAAADQSKAIAEQTYLANLLDYARAGAVPPRTERGVRVWEQIEVGLGVATPPTTGESVRQAERERIAFMLETAREDGGAYGAQSRRPNNFGRAAEYVRNMK